MDIETVSADSTSAVETKSPQAASNPQATEKPVETPAAETATGGDQDLQSDEPGDGDLEADQEVETDKPRKKKNGFRQQIDREKRKVIEREQEIAALKAQLSSQTKPNQETSTTAKSETDSEPNANDFDNNADYIKAYTKWELKLARQEQDKLASEAKAKESASAIQNDYNSRLDEFKKSTPDFDDVVSDFKDEFGDLQASPAVIETLMTSEFGPAILYDVMNTPGEYMRLSKMSEYQVIKELGKKEFQLSQAKAASTQETTQPKPKLSKAPPPVQPLGAGAQAISKSPQDMDTDEYLAWRKEQRKGK